MQYRATFLASLIGLASAQSVAADPPKLAVLVVVDQMRADYVDRFEGEWTGGLRRLLAGGAWFRRAAYPYLSTFTCSGHATIATGAFPAVHGVIQNAWFDRGRTALVTCTDDGRAKPVSYGTGGTASDGPGALLVPTFADEMRRQRGARVVALSLKARSAIMLAGHGGDAVTWRSSTLRDWETSTAFAESPVPQVRAFVAEHPVEADFGRTWERLLPPESYRGVDNGIGEAPPAGWTSTFPHVLSGAPGSSMPDTPYYQQWENSPYADAYLGRMAAALAESMQLGRREGTDVLAVAFSSPDLVGHGFGPRSQEVEDMYAHLDRTIGALLDALDRTVGKDQYVVALTSDHGVSDIPEQLVADKRDGGRLNTAGIVDAIEAAVQKAFGPGRAVARIVVNDVYFEPGVSERLAKSPAALTAVLAAVRSMPGVERVFHASELVGATTSRDRLLRAAALGYVSGRSGDLIISPRPGWMIGTTGTTHGSASDYDQQVPIVFYGKDIKSGTYTDAATPADVAPTLAAIFGITMPSAQGKALGRALRAPTTAASPATPRR